MIIIYCLMSVQNDEDIALLQLRFIGIIYLGMHQNFVRLLPENAIFVHIFRQKRPLL